MDPMFVNGLITGLIIGFVTGIPAVWIARVLIRTHRRRTINKRIVVKQQVIDQLKSEGWTDGWGWTASPEDPSLTKVGEGIRVGYRVKRG